MAGDAIDNTDDKSKRSNSASQKFVEFLSENPYDSATDSDIDDGEILPNRSQTSSLHRTATVLFSNGPMESEKKRDAGPWYDVVAFFFLGMSGWWVYNSLYMESPIFTDCENQTISSNIIMGSPDNSTPTSGYKCTLPEGDNITNQMVILGQIGNVFPFAYRLVGRFCGPRRIRLPLVIGIWLAIGCASAVGAAFFWQTHIRLFGQYDSSVPLLASTLFSGGLGCMSSMTYWQFAADFEISHTKALSIGMATGGLFPAIMSLAQNTGLDLTASSNFSPKVQMLIAAGVQVFFMVVFCRIAFLYFHLGDEGEGEGEAKAKEDAPKADPDREEELLSPLLENDSESARQAQSVSADSDAREEATLPLHQQAEDSEKPARGLCADGFSYVPYTTIFVLYACTYSLPSLAPYMITNYRTTKSIYTIMNFGYSLGDVLGRVAATGIPCLPSWTALLCMSVVVLSLFGFQLFAAAENVFVDCELLPGNLGYVFVAVQFCFYALRGYIVTNLYVRVKTDYAKSQHSKITARMSTIGQVGSFLGSLIPFLILTIFNLVPSNPASVCSS